MPKEKRTYADRREYMIQAVAKRRQRLKEMVIEYKSGKCAIREHNKYPGAFDLHHKDGSRKEFGPSMR
jgi:hypothetical protein